jgi:hypothetical protein
MLNPEQIQLASTAVRELRVALSNFFLYSSDNAMVQQSLERFLKILGRLFESLPSVVLGESEGRLVVEGTPLDERATGSLNMIKDLFLIQKIHSLAFLKGLQAEEVKVFFEFLKPKALSPGQSLFEALSQKKLSHIRLNEKVFVAIKEGEKVVSGEEPAMGGEDNLQEALEALQYFLQIFARVKPETNKKEVAQKLMENIGGCLQGENLLTAPKPSPQAQVTWREVLGGFQMLQKNLASVHEPGQLKSTQLSMEDMLQKLVRLGEGQGLGAIGGGEKEAICEEQYSLFETDPAFTQLRSGQLELLTDSEQEGAAGNALIRLQSPREGESFQKVWTGLWKNVFSGDDKTQGVGLRHLNRLQWEKMPRSLQLEGLKNLRHFLGQEPRPSTYFIALSLVQNWLPLELTRPKWDEVLAMTSAIGVLAKKNPPLFEQQTEAARATLSSVFYPPALEGLYQVPLADDPEKESQVKLFSILSSLTVPFLMEKIKGEFPETEDWKKAVELLHRIEMNGIPVYERWLNSHPGSEEMISFLEIFRQVNWTPGLADYVEKNWENFSPEVLKKNIEIIGRWKRTDFHPVLMKVLNGHQPDLALAALRVLPRVGMEGDAREVVGTLKRFPAESREKEIFWLEACRVLGELADPYSISFLMEWAERYKFLENKRERSLSIRLAALEALSHFKSNNVLKFLGNLRNEPEKEVEKAASASFLSVQEKIKKEGVVESGDKALEIEKGTDSESRDLME